MRERELSGSMEDYLETILLLQKENPVARAKEISEKLGVKMSSVTNALKHLSEKGFINYDRYSFITLTKEGEKYAENIFLRHEVLKKFLSKVVGLNEEQSEENACRMEHVMDMEVISKINKLIDFIEKENISQEFEKYVKENPKMDE